MAWLTQGVRCVFYAGVGAPQPDVMDLWKILAPNSQPDTVQRQRSTPMLQATASGEEGGVRLSIVTQPGRSDLFFAPGGDPFDLDRTADHKALLKRAGERMEAALGNYRTARVALVLDLLQPTASHEESAAAMQTELPFIDVPQGARDLVFQVNRPRTFSQKGAPEMFRLCKWSGTVLQLMTLTLNGRAGSPAQFVQSASTVEARHALLYEMDVSSAPREGLLDAALARRLFIELCEEVLTLADKGYSGLTR